MKLNNFALREGKIVYVPDVPKKPHFLEDATDHAQYKTSLAFAIANGIEVENQDEIMRHIFRTNEKDQYVLEGKLYTLQCRVEVVDVPVFTDTWKEDYVRLGLKLKTKTLARVTFEQPEKADSVQWQDIMTTAAGQEHEEIERYRINAEEDYKNTPISVLRYISELENITRKP